MTNSAWRLIRRRSTAAEFHALDIPSPASPEIWVHEITKPALVLGSTQRDGGIVDTDACHRAGIEIVRRRSGGGAVLLVPGEVAWVDVILPAGHAGWSDDVHAPMVWLGERFARAFEAAGLIDVSVHRGALVSTEHSRLICFDGLGPGEVTVRGAKLVGISQRRTRAAARLQCCWYEAYDPATLTRLLVDAPNPAALSPVGIVDPMTSTLVVDSLAGALSAAS